MQQATYSIHFSENNRCLNDAGKANEIIALREKLYLCEISLNLEILNANKELIHGIIITCILCVHLFLIPSLAPIYSRPLKFSLDCLRKTAVNYLKFLQINK